MCDPVRIPFSPQPPKFEVLVSPARFAGGEWGSRRDSNPHSRRNRSPCGTPEPNPDVPKAIERTGAVSKSSDGLCGSLAENSFLLFVEGLLKMMIVAS